MANPYEVPFTPPDLGPAVALFTAARQRRKENKRADQYAEMQALAMDRSYERESHAQARQKAEDERRHQIEAITAMPTLMRAAQQSTGLGNMYGKPHGVSFSETHDLPANVEGPEMSPDAEAARFASAGQPTLSLEAPEQAIPQSPPDFSRERMPSVSAEMRGAPQEPAIQPSGYQGGGVDAFGDVERQRAADNMNAVGAGLQGPPPEAPSPEAPLMARAAANTLNMEPGPEGKRRLIASYGGGSFAVPEQSETTGFGEKYDAIYKRALQEPGVTPEEAYKFVAKMAHDDSTESGRNQRLKDSLGHKDTSREDQQSFQARQDSLYRSEPTTAAEREKLARLRAQAGAGFKQEGVNDRLFGLLDRRAKAVRETGQFTKLAGNDKVVRGIAANLASGTEGLQHKDAQIQLARYFRQAQPTEGEMHLLYQNLGGWTDSFNQFKAKVLKGDLSPEQLRQMRKSAKTVIKEHNEDKHRFYQVARAGLGPGSGLDIAPDQAQKQFDMMAAELGIEPGELPPLYETEGGVTLGTKQAPSVRPRGAKKSALDELEDQLDTLGVER